MIMNKSELIYFTLGPVRPFFWVHRCEEWFYEIFCRAFTALNYKTTRLENLMSQNSENPKFRDAAEKMVEKALDTASEKSDASDDSEEPIARTELTS